MSDPYTPPQTAWAADYAQPVTGRPAPAPPPPAPNRAPWIVGAAIVGVLLLAGVTGLLFAFGAFDGRETAGSPDASGRPTAEDPAADPAGEPDTGGAGGAHAFVDDVCAGLDFTGYQALGDLASGYDDRSADYGDTAALGCDMDFGDGGELRVEGMLAPADKTAENWDFATGLLRNRTQEPAAGAWEEGLVGIDDSWGPGKTDAILAVRDGNLVVTVAFYSINDGVGYEKVKSLLSETAASVLAATAG